MGARIVHPNCYPESHDTQLSTLEKILQCGTGGGGGGDAGGGSGDCPACNFSGSGSPEGVVTGVVGSRYYDILNDDHYIKATGSGNTGWAAYIA